MLADLAQGLLGGKAGDPVFSQTMSMAYATAVADSSDGTVRVVMDGESVVHPSGVEETVTIPASAFSYGRAELPSRAYAGTVTVADSDGNLLLADEYQVDGDILTVEALSGSKPVEVAYTADVTMVLTSEDFEDDSASLPFIPSGPVAVTDSDGAAVECSVEDGILSIVGASVQDDAAFSISYESAVSLTASFEDGTEMLPDEPGSVSIMGISLHDDAEPEEAAVTGFELEGNIVTLVDATPYDQYRIAYTLPVEIGVMYSDTLPADGGDGGGAVELDGQPSEIAVTKDGEAYTGWTVDGGTLSLNWLPAEPASYSIAFPSEIALDLSTSDFADGAFQLPAAPSGPVETLVDGVAAENSVDGYMLAIPSLVAEIGSYTVTYQAEVESGEVELPCAPSVKEGETVQVTIVNGTPMVTAVMGEGDRQNAGIEEATSIAEAAQQTALDGAFLVISSTNGQLFKNGAESTVLQVAVFPNGGDRLETIEQVRSRFGAASYIEWRWMHESSGEWGTLLSTDPHLSQGGMWLTVTPDDVATKTTFSASLVVPGEEE